MSTGNEAANEIARAIQKGIDEEIASAVTVEVTDAAREDFVTPSRRRQGEDAFRARTLD